MATQPGPTGEPKEPLPYKTWVLKVSIHCEGCKRKVQKVLHSVEGVYTVNIDTKLQKVVVNGNVDAVTLIKKLEKSGKHAELWPEIVEKKKKKKKRKSKKKEKQSDPESSSDGEEEGEGGEGHGGSSEKDKPAVKVEVVLDSAKVVDTGGSPSKASESGGGGGAGSVSVKFADAAAKITAGSGGGQAAAESKSEGKKPETGSPGGQSPAVDKNAGESEGVAAGQSGGGKKKKKKGHKSTAEGEPSNVGAPAPTGLAHHNAGPPPVNHSPPGHSGYQYPTHFYAPPQPVYAVSYNTAYPTSSYTASYYTSQPPPSHACMHSGSYVHYGPEGESPPSDADYYPRQPLDSFELFSDENPNGCSVM